MKPTHVCYNSVISAWSNSGHDADAIDRAANILKYIQTYDMLITDGDGKIGNGTSCHGEEFTDVLDHLGDAVRFFEGRSE